MSNSIDKENETNEYLSKPFVKKEREQVVKDFNSFFMTQIDQEETEHKKTDAFVKKSKKNESKKESKSYAEATYEFLYNIDNEEQIKVPKGKILNLKNFYSELVLNFKLNVFLRFGS